MLTMPYRLRDLMAWNHDVSRAVLGVYARVRLGVYARGVRVPREVRARSVQA